MRGRAAFWWPFATTSRLWHLQRVLEKTNLRRHDIVVMTVRQLSTGAAEYDLRDDQLFADYEQELFSHVVSLAEKEGKTVELLVVPAVDPFDAMVQTAQACRRRAWSPASRRAWPPRNWPAALASPGNACPSRGIRSRSK